jgi:hypothetical protein
LDEVIDMLLVVIYGVYAVEWVDEVVASINDDLCLFKSNYPCSLSFRMSVVGCWASSLPVERERDFDANQQKREPGNCKGLFQSTS